MKMKFWDRLGLRVGAALSLCAGAVSIAGGILLWGHEMDSALLNAIPLVLLLAGAIAVLAALYVLCVLRRYSPRYQAFIKQVNEMGELRIAVSAIENLVLKCVEAHKEVKVQDLTITNRHGAVSVAMRVAMDGNVSIPHAMEQLQTQIKRYIAASSGIELRSVSMTVERSFSEAESADAQAQAESMPVEAQTEEKPSKPKKIPLHQRIFGRDPKKTEAEQIAEAELIDLPSTEEEEVSDAEAPAVEDTPNDAQELAPADSEEAPAADTTEE